MQIKGLLGVLSVLALAACEPVVVRSGGPSGGESSGGAPSQGVVNASPAAAAFVAVAEGMEPVIERECRQRAPNLNCDFRIMVDDRRGVPANAYQTLSKQGQPLIIFTEPLIKQAKNRDELAFVLGHEAAHHIENHLARQRENTELGAVVFGGLATALGGNAQSVESAARLGATVGSRSYSKEFELEADALGTILTARAGYNPIRGAEFFNRIPDPGDRFLGTHPPNADRIATVRRTAAGL